MTMDSRSGTKPGGDGVVMGRAGNTGLDVDCCGDEVITMDSRSGMKPGGNTGDGAEEDTGGLEVMTMDSKSGTVTGLAGVVVVVVVVDVVVVVTGLGGSLHTRQRTNLL